MGSSLHNFPTDLQNNLVSFIYVSLPNCIKSNGKCYKNDKFLAGKICIKPLIMSPFDKDVTKRCMSNLNSNEKTLPVASQHTKRAQPVFLCTQSMHNCTLLVPLPAAD
jgi:hypothetical protein